MYIASLFGVGKYFHNFHSSKVGGFVAKRADNRILEKFSKELAGYRVSIFDKGSPGAVLDIDEPKDLEPVRQIMRYEENNRSRRASYRFQEMGP
jgi:hypothetical protein